MEVWYVSRIMIFAGIKEAISLCEEVSSLDSIIDVYAESESLLLDYPKRNNINIHITSLSEEDIKYEYEKIEPDIVVNGVEEKNTILCESIKDIVENKKYIKLKEEKEKFNVVYCEDMKELISVVNRTRSNIYFTNEALEIDELDSIKDFKKRIYADLPRGNAILLKAATKGISINKVNYGDDHSKENIVSFIKENNIKYLIASSDESEEVLKMKYDISVEENIIMIILNSGEESYTVDEAIEKIKEIDCLKQVYIIGGGVGSYKNMTVEAIEAIDKVEVVIGEKRFLNILGIKNKRHLFSNDPVKIKDFIDSHNYNKIAIILDGNVSLYNNFYEYIKVLREFELIVLQGISAVAYFSARLGLDLSKAKVVNSERDNYVRAVLENKHTFIYTNDDTNIILRQLKESGFEDNFVCIAQNLSLKNELILTGSLYEYENEKFSDLTMIYIENKEYKKIRLSIEDESFYKGGLYFPDKSFRAILIKDLELLNNEIVFDVGCGCGATSVEIGLICDRSQVFAIEESEQAKYSIKKNIKSYFLNNVKAIVGDMNKIIEKLPNPSCVLIHSNYKGDIVELVKDISKENECRFVVACKGLESTYRLLEFMTKNGFEDVEMKQVNISGSSDITNGLNMEVRENSFIVKGKGKIFWEKKHLLVL